MRSSPGPMLYSGCHCTPRQKRRPGASMPSMTPSGARVDDDTRRFVGRRLMMGAVHRHPVGADNAMQQGTGDDVDRVAGFGTRVGLLVGQRVGHAVGNVLD